MIEVARISCRACSVMMPSQIPRLARMNENSPICASEAATSSAASRAPPSRRTATKAIAGVMTSTRISAPTIGSGSSTRIVGSNSIPTETKNSTANASRSGSDSSAATWLSADSLSVMPAIKAPSANDTSNSCEAKNATPRATDRTASRNSSRDPVWAT